MIVYSEHTTNRLTYILDLLLSSMLGIDFSISNDINETDSANEPVINYSSRHIQGAFQIVPCGLLFDSQIVSLDLPAAGMWEGLPVFFESDEGNLPFDLFAASFFLVTRYEEYLPFPPDKHGRYSSGLSYAGKQNFHHLPVINMWVRKLGELLQLHFPSLPISPPVFQFQSTIDIDHAWAFQHKSFVRTSFGLLKCLVKMDFEGFAYRLNVFCGKLPDPYYTFPEWDILHRDMKDKVVLFILTSAASSYDMTISPRNRHWRKLVAELSEKYITGIHPSYDSDQGWDTLKNEKVLLELVSGKSVSKSRQHFVRLRFPDTYRNLIGAGIREDYSMGFHDTSGFRAGIAYPFKFFDVDKNQATELMIYPFAIMERTLKDYMGYNHHKALEVISETIQKVRDSGGIFISIWHNSSLNDYGEWEGWKETYQRMNELCKNNVV